MLVGDASSDDHEAKLISWVMPALKGSQLFSELESVLLVS